jgi:hypothetical protein
MVFPPCSVRRSIAATADLPFYALQKLRIGMLLNIELAW